MHGGITDIKLSPVNLKDQSKIAGSLTSYRKTEQTLHRLGGLFFFGSFGASGKLEMEMKLEIGTDWKVEMVVKINVYTSLLKRAIFAQ